jgi:predicted TIM-barrel fold metal-dependent hydrolase
VSPLARLGRRGFLLALASAGAACTKLVTTAYPRAPRCDPGACSMVDVHCHVFNASDLNVSGFISHILPLPRAWTTWLTTKLHQQLDRRAVAAKDELRELEALIAEGTPIHAGEPPQLSSELTELTAELTSKAPVLAASRSAGMLADTLALIVRPRREIAAALIETYAQIDLFTPAMVDYAYWSSDVAESPLGDQLALHSALSRASMRGLLGRPEARLHPFAPFNPLRELRELALSDAPGESLLGSWQADARAPYACDAAPLPSLPTRGALGPLRFAIENLGFVGAKVYPPTGFLPLGNAGWSHHQATQLGEPLDRALLALYAYCEAEEVPLLTHANDSNGYNLGYGLLTDPDVWEPVLARFPRLRLNLGHFGALTGDDAERGSEACELWLRKIASLMQRYPNVYADTGASLVPVEEAHQKRYLSLLQKVYADYPRVAKRLMYGSDYWLNALEPNSERFVDTFSALYRAHFPELHTDFFGTNALRFLGFVDDQGQKSAHNRNRARLTAWYGTLPRPAWL